MQSDIPERIRNGIAVESRQSFLSKRKIILLVIAFSLVVALGVDVELGHPSMISRSSFNQNLLLDQSGFGYVLSHPLSQSAPGIASYGVYNQSGSVQPYTVNTSEVIGRATIGALSAIAEWNSSTDSNMLLGCIQCASLQMNVNILVQTSAGNQTYWVQNVVLFWNTFTMEVGPPHGVIFNATSINGNITAASAGNGQILHYYLDNAHYTAYAFAPFTSNSSWTLLSLERHSLPVNLTLYSLPMNITLTTSVGVDHDRQGIKITMTDGPFGVGTMAPGNDTFGVVNLPIRNVLHASILVTPSFLWSNGRHGIKGNYDAELVWSGYCCYQTAKFLVMNSNLSLLYENAYGRTVSFPSFYTFGSDTGESAFNLSVSPIQGGARITIGESREGYLNSSLEA